MLVRPTHTPHEQEATRSLLTALLGCTWAAASVCRDPSALHALSSEGGEPLRCLERVAERAAAGAAGATPEDKATLAAALPGLTDSVRQHQTPQPQVATMQM